MSMSSVRGSAILASCLVFTGVVLLADGTRFSDFTPLGSSAGPAADESTPITFGNPDFQQRSIADRSAQLTFAPNSGDWDMNTVNETGPHKGRYLFTVFESGQSGVQRHDLLTGRTDTIWHSAAPGAHVAFDPSFWTPWGTLITAEESWCTAVRDLNKDGDLLDVGEGLGRWASNGTVGSEFTGLYFDPTNKRRAWVNIQHPDSGNDRTIEITIPEPEQ